MHPLVSCIMPTYGRRKYVNESVAMFLAQDYEPKELLIGNDCPGQTLWADLPGVRVINYPERASSLGAKRNDLIQRARGKYIAVWDDDDIYMPWRLKLSVQEIEAAGTPVYFPENFWGYWGEQNLHDNHISWISHGLWLLRKDAWERVGGYPDITVTEDSGLLSKLTEQVGQAPYHRPIPQHERFYIYRGWSDFKHTCLPTGAAPPDTTPGVFEVVPKEIEDRLLLREFKQLIKDRTFRRHLSGSSSELILSVATEIGGQEVTTLDVMEPVEAVIGHGSLGLHGDLGFDQKRVTVAGVSAENALGVHAPSQLSYRLDGQFESFTSFAAINGDVSPQETAADFKVFVDDRLAAISTNVRSLGIPRLITADVRGATDLRLVVEPRKAHHCHSVWLNPTLTKPSDHGPDKPVRLLVDPLGRAEIVVPQDLEKFDLCIATAGSPGFEDWIDDLLGSIVSNANCPGAMLAVFFYGESQQMVRVAEQHGALLIQCRPLKPASMAYKSVLFSAANVLPASKFLCLDADIVVLGDLSPIVQSLDAIPQSSVLVAREALGTMNLGEALRGIYSSDLEKVSRMLEDDLRAEMEYNFVVNNGVFAAAAPGLRAMDRMMRSWPKASTWIDDPSPYIAWRDQFVFNLALARLQCGVELDGRFNVQLGREKIEMRGGIHDVVRAGTREPVAVAHFNGGAKGSYPELRGRFRSNS